MEQPILGLFNSIDQRGIELEWLQDYWLAEPSLPGFEPQRMFGVRLTESLKQQIVVDNRASASGVIAGELTAKALPDGYTLFMAYHQHTVNAALNPRLPYHAVNDFTAISQEIYFAPVRNTADSLVNESRAGAEISEAPAPRCQCSRAGASPSSPRGCWRRVPMQRSELSRVRSVHCPQAALTRRH